MQRSPEPGFPENTVLYGDGWNLITTLSHHAQHFHLWERALHAPTGTAQYQTLALSSARNICRIPRTACRIRSWFSISAKRT